MDNAIERYRQAILQEKQRQRLSWEELSEKADVSLQHTRRIAHQRINPTLENADRILAAIGIGIWGGAPLGGDTPCISNAALTYDELCMMDGDPVWMELPNGKFVCVLIYQRNGAPVALGFAVFVTGKLEPVAQLLDEGIAFYQSPPKGGH